MSLLQKHQATQALEPSDPRWMEFQVTTGTVRSVTVSERGILWSQFLGCGYHGDYFPYPIQQMLFDQQNTPPEEPWDVCLFDTASNTITAAHSGGNLDNPQMDGDWLVMDRNKFIGQVVAKNLTTGETRNIWGTFQRTTVPHIHNNIVIASPISKTLSAYAIDTQVYTTVVVMPDYPPLWNVLGDVYKNIVVWSYYQSDPEIDSAILGFDLQTHKTFTISNQPSNLVIPRIDNNIVVWSWDGDIFGYELEANQLFTITDHPAWQTGPQISNHTIVWADDRNGAGWDIYAYNLETGKEYRVTSASDSTIQGLDIWDNLIVWERGETGPNGLYASEIRAARLMSHFQFLPFVSR
jgi:beta propeller repeat protein